MIPNKKAIYIRLKNINIRTQIKHISIFHNKDTNEKGWNFILTDNRKGKLIIGKPGLTFID